MARQARDTTVVVAGAGIGGLACGAALARAGIAVTILERAPRITGIGSGIVVGPNGIKALDAVSRRLGAAVRAAGYQARPGHARPWLTPAGEVLSSDPIGELGPRFRVVVLDASKKAYRSRLREETIVQRGKVRDLVKQLGELGPGFDVFVLDTRKKDAVPF